MAIQATSAVPSAAANGKHGHSLISDEKFRQLYTLALNFHLAAQRGVSALAGREAALAGVSADLHPEDLLIAEHDRVLFDGPRVESHDPHQPHLQPHSVMAERVIDAVSMAVANRMRHNHRVTVLFFAGDPTGQLLSEARAIAAEAKLPVIFVEQGREPAASPRRSAGQNGSSADLISIPVDAHDVIAMYRVAHESIARARHGNGPTRIVCVSRVAVEAGRNSAVANLEAWLTARGLPAQQWRQEIVAKHQSNSTDWQDTSGSSEFPENAA